MKILLLAVNSDSFFYGQGVIPFGLASLGTYVQDDGHEIRGIDMSGPPDVIERRYMQIDTDLLRTITDHAPDLVAMSTYAENIHNVLFWARQIKTSLPDSIVALGGNHASYIADEVLRACPAVDLVVRFEGELPFNQLCDSLEQGDRSFASVPNAVYRRDGEIVSNDVLPLIRELDILPPLNRSFFATSRESLTHADVFSARGCPFHCTFCNCNHYWGKKYRTRPVEQVVDELRQLKAENPNLRTVRFRDEAVSISKRHCAELCDALREADLGLEYHAHSRLDGLNEDAIQRLAGAGFTELYIGMESGSQAVLDRMRKGIRIDRAPEVVDALRRHGVGFQVSFILGSPDETMPEAIETIDLIDRLDLAFDQFSLNFGLIIYPGTAECQRFLAEFPKYRWLQQNELPNGYHEELDAFGNVKALVHHAPGYKPADLHQEINTRLAHRLQRHHERDHRKLQMARRGVAQIADRFGTLDSARSQIRSLLQTVDKLGEPWAVCGTGYYRKHLLADLFESPVFENCEGLFSISENERCGTISVDQDTANLRYLVLAFEEGNGRAKGVADHLAETGSFSGTVLFLGNLLRAADCEEFLQNASENEIVNRAEFRYTPRCKTRNGVTSREAVVTMST